VGCAELQKFLQKSEFGFAALNKLLLPILGDWGKNVLFTFVCQLNKASLYPHRKLVTAAEHISSIVAALFST
jgi:hypothetical protein